MILTFCCMQLCITVARTRIFLIDCMWVAGFVTKHNKVCSLPYAMTANKTYLSTYFLFKTSLLIKRMSLINKVNFKKCFSENYKRMRLTTRVYGIYKLLPSTIYT